MLNVSFLTRFNSTALRLIAYTLERRVFCDNMDKKKALLVITDGSEEMEAVISANILRRAGVHLLFAMLNAIIIKRYLLSIRCRRIMIIIDTMILLDRLTLQWLVYQIILS